MSYTLNAATSTNTTAYDCAVCGEPTVDFALVREPWPHHVDLCPKHMTDADVAASEAR
jgi:hypothetical protein